MLCFAVGFFKYWGKPVLYVEFNKSKFVYILHAGGFWWFGDFLFFFPGGLGFFV